MSYDVLVIRLVSRVLYLSELCYVTFAGRNLGAMYYIAYMSCTTDVLRHMTIYVLWLTAGCIGSLQSIFVSAIGKTIPLL